MAGKLTDRDMLFVDEYLVDLDAKHAAIRAGYSPKTAAKASEWIRPDNPTKKALRAEIDKRLAERSRRTGVTADRVIRELAKIAFADPSDIIDFDSGEICPYAERDDFAAVASVKVKTTVSGNTEREIRMADKTRAIELLGRHLGMFEKKPETGQPGSGVKIIKTADGGIEVDDGEN